MDLCQRISGNGAGVNPFSSAIRFQSLTSAELDRANYKVEYLIDGLLVKNQPGVIAGAKKTLKTSLSIAMAMSLSSGDDVFEQFTVPRPVRCAVFSAESGDGVIADTAKRVARSLGKPFDAFDNILWNFSVPHLGRPVHVDALRDYIVTNNVEMLVLDPAYMCLDVSGAETANLFTMGSRLGQLTEIGQDTDCTILLVHHTRKRSRQNGSQDADGWRVPDLEDLAFAGFAEWCRQWVMIGRREAYSAARPGSHKLLIGVGGSAGHSGEWAVNVEEGSLEHGARQWDLTIKESAEARREATRDAQREKQQHRRQIDRERMDDHDSRVLEALKKTPDGDTVSNIRDRAGMKSAQVHDALSRLIDKGLAEKCVVVRGKNRKGYDAYRFTRDDSGFPTVPECFPSQHFTREPGQPPL